MNTTLSTHVMDYQQGVGLIEVLISLLLLAVAIMGFSFLQMTTIKSTDESLTITNATTYSNSIAEIMRNNVSILPQLSTVISSGVSLKNCDSEACNKSEKAQFELKKIKDQAYSQGILTNMIVCPGTKDIQNTHCLIIAWDNTTATVGAGLPNCISTGGVRVSGSTCLVLEIY